MKKLLTLLLIFMPFSAQAICACELDLPTKTYDSELTSKLKGYILLQVQNNGEAWYLDPITEKRYYMKDGSTAYEMMRSFGLGITNSDLADLLLGKNNLKQRLMGRIVLQVEKNGEAYYIDPHYGGVHYLKDGAEAYRLMRELSLGITNTDLNKIPSENFTPIDQNISATENLEAEQTEEPEESSFSPDQTLSNLNNYWLIKINSLRAEKNLRQLVIDNRFVETASEWANYMKETGNITHTRPDGKSMHQWIDAKNLDFTTRDSEDGWQTNYFTENISYGYASDLSKASIEKVLDESLQMFLNEESYNGAHYRTIYHQDWNCLGLGISYETSQYGYKVYTTQHYGSLNLN